MTNGTRCVVVVDEALAPGLAANAAAVMAMTLGAKVPDLVGEDFEDGGGARHPGLITSRAFRCCAHRPASSPALRARAVEAEIGVVGFPASGQTTTDYEAFRAMVASTAAPDYLGLAFYGAGEGGPPPHREPRAPQRLGVRDDRDLPQDRRGDRRDDARTIAIATTIRWKRLVSLAVCLAFSACSIAFSSQRAAQANSRHRIASADRDHGERRTGQDEHRDARPASVKPTTTISTRSHSGRSAWISRWPRRRSTSGGFGASSVLILLL